MTGQKPLSMSKKHYTVYLKKNDQIVAVGTSEECTKQLGLKNVDSFYSIVSKNRNGKHSKYDVVAEESPYDEEEM